MSENKYYALDNAYMTLVECGGHLSTLETSIEKDFNNETDKFFSNPLRYGPNYSLERATSDYRSDAIKFIIRDISLHKIYKNLIVDEDRILKLFGIGYGSIQKYGAGFDSQDVVDSFNELYPLEFIESILYTQILHTAQKSINRFRHQDRTIERFGKNNDGLLLHFSQPSTANTNYTSALLKLIEILLIPVKPSCATHVNVESGKTYSALSYKSVRGYLNGNLRVVFNSKEDADIVCDLLLQEDTENVL